MVIVFRYGLRRQNLIQIVTQSGQTVYQISISNQYHGHNLFTKHTALGILKLDCVGKSKNQIARSGSTRTLLLQYGIKDLKG